MGVVLGHGHCFGCGTLFAFNPVRVPSFTPPGGTREPICLACVERVNPMRVKNGLDPIVPHPDAYEPADEFEL